VLARQGDRLDAIAGRPGDLVPGHCDHDAPQRLARQEHVVDDPDPHRTDSPIRSTTVSSRVWSWKLLLVREASAPASSPRIRSSSRSLYETMTMGSAWSRGSPLIERTSAMPSMRGMSTSLMTSW